MHEEDLKICLKINSDTCLQDSITVTYIGCMLMVFTSDKELKMFTIRRAL